MADSIEKAQAIANFMDWEWQTFQDHINRGEIVERYQIDTGEEQFKPKKLWSDRNIQHKIFMKLNREGMAAWFKHELEEMSSCRIFSDAILYEDTETIFDAIFEGISEFASERGLKDYIESH